MKLKLLLTGILVICGATAYAQTSASVLATVTPSNPAPNEDVTVSLNSYAENLDTVLIEWFIAGKNMSSGIGKKTFFLKAPAAGLETVVVAAISLPSGKVETRVTIKSSEMVLLWQANDSYVPPFYRGKALPSIGSEIKVIAMPEIVAGGSVIDPKIMTYGWRKDYTNNQASSGYGKNSFTYTNDYLENSNTVSVTASTTDQRNTSEGSVSVGAAESKILFYKNDDNLGTLWENTLTDGHRIEGTETIEADPYFLTPKQFFTPRIAWNWFINGNRINLATFRKNLMPVAVQSGVSGISTIRLEVENKDSLFPATTNEIKVEF